MSDEKKRLLDRLSPGVLKWGINLWPPFLGAGIKIKHIAPDFRFIEVRMKLRWYNKNYVGTHFGGSMYAMTDPFFMLMVMKYLGSDYIVWDKAASIEYKKVARGTLSAQFRVTEEELQLIKYHADTNEKYIFDRPIDLTNDAGEVVASLVRTLYVRKKNNL
ncbi:MAG: DUF4442 domain-containing protein [Gammaproteobacteria bacterium]|nr:DUF4442 domain-containing protein [Gammaproteobacteria bacterium]